MMPATDPADFTGLPDFPAIRELKTHRQWVAWAWRMVDGRLTKPPINPHNGLGAKHSDPVTWGDYKQAEARAMRFKLAGVGFVLSPDDDYTGADLDKCRDPATGALDPWAAEIIAFAETYTEVSPSGTGLRMIWRGKVPISRKADPMHVEIYCDRRYLTITGEHVPGTPTTINPAPRSEAALMARVEAYQDERKKARAETLPAATRGQPVHTLPAGRGGEFFRRTNTAALAALSNWVPSLFGPAARFQDGTRSYRISSRALARDLEEDLSIAPNGIVDFGIHDMGDARDGKRTAVDLVLEFGGMSTAKDAAFWLCARLGKDPADLGWEERSGGGDAAHGALIASALLGKSLVEQEDGTVIDEETGEIHEPAAPEQDDLPEDLTHVPGLLGGLVDWMTDSAERPSRMLNLGAAVVFLGALFGRRYAAPKGNMTNFYIVTLADSGFGKSHPMERISDLCFSAGIEHLLAGSRIKSDTGLRSRVEQSGSVFYQLDEFGAHIRPWLSSGANKQHNANIRDLILTLFSSARGVHLGEDYGAGPTETIYNPNLCLYGTCTGQDFWRSLEGGAVVDGFLARFILFDAGRTRPRTVTPILPFDPPATIIEAVRAASGLKGRHNLSGKVKAGTAKPKLLPVPWGPGAEDLWNETRVLMDDELIAADPDDRPIISRINEHGQKLALVRAVGCDWAHPAISVADLEWGLAVARASAAMMLSRAGDLISSNPFQADYLKVRRMIREAKAAGLTRRDLAMRLKGVIEPRKLKDVLDMLKGAGEVEEHPIKSARGPARIALVAVRDAKK